jgi:hypothetical protein
MKKALEFFDPEGIAWEPVEGMPGMEQKILSGDKNTPNHTRLARVAGGITYDIALSHDFYEEIWILEGTRARGRRTPQACMRVAPRECRTDRSSSRNPRCSSRCATAPAPTPPERRAAPPTNGVLHVS